MVCVQTWRIADQLAGWLLGPVNYLTCTLHLHRSLASDMHRFASVSGSGVVLLEVPRVTESVSDTNQKLAPSRSQATHSSSVTINDTDP